MGSPHRIGIVGLGYISGVYLDFLAGVPDVVITKVADINDSRAREVADRISTARAVSVDELVASEDVDLVLNLTTPDAHASVTLAAIAHGKEVYVEKPLTANMNEAAEVMEAARAAGVRVGCAPDTVLGTGIQTARCVVDAGRIGRPLAATAVMAVPGHELWHPNPDFYYRAGGGPLLDMGPYYVTALVQILGPVRSVIGAASRLRDQRQIASGPRAGELFPVEVDSHVTGVLEHVSGALSTITMSFDSTASAAPRIEVHGELGSLQVPDPNCFEGDVSLRLLGSETWETIAVSAGFTDAARGAGAVDLLRTPAGELPRASSDLAYHVLETMTALLDSAASGKRNLIQSTVQRPSPVPLVAIREVAT